MVNVYLTHTSVRFGQLVVFGMELNSPRFLESRPSVGHACQLVSWIIQAPAPPFPLFVIAYFLGGFGFAMQVIPIVVKLSATHFLKPQFQDAQLNGFVAALEHHKEIRICIIHAFFGVYRLVLPFFAERISGLGALVVPLVSTKFADSPHWSFHYLTSIGVAFICIVCSSLVFRFKKQDGVDVSLIRAMYH